MTSTTGRRLVWALIPLAVLVWAGCSSPSDRPADPETAVPVGGGATAANVQEIRSVLGEQVAAWNRGSIREFMEGYAKTDTLRFASGGNIQRGWNRTLVRYQDTYADEGLVGRLQRHRNLAALGSTRNSWELSRSESYTDIGGLFTLIFENGPNGWKIVHDHTSARQMLESQQDTLDVRP